MGRASQRLADTLPLRTSDVVLRRAGLARGLDDEVARLDPTAHQELAAFAEGINDGFGQFGRSLPMWLCGLRPEPWNVAGVLLMGKLLAYAGLAMGQHRSERILVELVQAGIDPDRWRVFYRPHLDHTDFDLLRRVHVDQRILADHLPPVDPLPKLAGSNAWAVAGNRSATGGALLASDPHLETGRLPTTWYESVLEWGDGEWVTGVCLPGTPLFAVGRTRRLAWGVTYTQGDTTDLFLEDCRIEQDRVQYRRGDAWHDFKVRREVVLHAVEGSTDLPIYTNPQGTLLGDPRRQGPGLYLLSAWTGEAPGSAAQSVEIMLGLPNQRRVDQAMQHLRQCQQPPLCWVLADAQGHIGRQVAGCFPRRGPKASGLAPVPAWDEANHWQGWIDPELLPREYDPPEGFLATANEHLTARDGTPLTTLAAATYRRDRIASVLEDSDSVSVSTCQALQYDCYSLQAERMLAALWNELPAGPFKNRMATWDRRYTVESVEATLYHEFYYGLLYGVFGRSVEHGGIGPRRLLAMADLPAFSLLTLGYADRVLLDPDSPWWTGVDRGTIIRQVAERVDIAGGVPWGKKNAIPFNNAFLPGLISHVLGLNAGQVEIAGCFATPHQGHLAKRDSQQLAYAPSFHFVTDLSEQRTWTNLPGGASESLFQPHYADDLRLWREAIYKSLGPHDPTGLDS